MISNINVLSSEKIKPRGVALGVFQVYFGFVNLSGFSWKNWGGGGLQENPRYIWEFGVDLKTAERWEQIAPASQLFVRQANAVPEVSPIIS